MQLHKLNLHTASTPGLEPGGGGREHSLLPPPCSINCPIYQFRVYLEVKYFQASVIIHWQYIFLPEEEIGGLKKSQKLDQNRSPGVIKIGNVTSKTADRTQQPKAVEA